MTDDVCVCDCVCVCVFVYVSLCVSSFKSNVFLLGMPKSSTQNTLKSCCLDYIKLKIRLGLTELNLF